ncbi:dihydrolipoamide dehydrogenase [Pedobacter sp. UYP30]|uniref:dihydrolipoyl dehydrogenase n=1 Tax=Pedobacter sp. UYP30 TaxID=1756400 RepID=UPI0033952EBE
MLKNYDVVIIGSGQAGNPLAKKFAQAGKKTVLIEKDVVGGTCINYGCTPTKTMIASAKLAFSARNATNMAIGVGKVSVKMADIIDRKNAVVKMFREGSEKGLRKTEHLDLIFGEASFTGEKQIEIKGKYGETKGLKAELFFIDTGTEAIIPPIAGLSAIRYLTSTTIMELDEVPKHLLIIGGNYIGLEFGQMFSRFGSKVTIIERSDRLLKREDKEISSAVSDFLKEEKIEILTNSEVDSFVTDKKNKIIAKLKNNENVKQVSCTHVLIAVGRKPTTEVLKLEKTGVKMDSKGFIEVDTKLETNIKGIYALGDVNGGPAFTHIAYNDFAVVYRNILEGKNLSTKNRQVPYCMFTDPQLGSIGMTEQEAKEGKIDYKVATLTMDTIGRAIETGETKGLMRAIIDTKTKKILGASILAAQGGEIMSILQMAMAGGITYEQLRYFIFAHPTYAEALNNLFMQLD